MSKVLLLDNYDSFTYNLYHLCLQAGAQNIDIIKNDQLQAEDAAAYDFIIISPGPDLPDAAGITKPLIEKWGPYKPILGICLGHQAIGEIYGGKLRRLEQVRHGQKSRILQTSTPGHLYQHIPDGFEAGRYHSWVVDEKDIQQTDLIVTAVDEEGTIMSLEHAHYPVYGIQYHPESYMTQEGLQLMRNFFKSKRAR